MIRNVNILYGRKVAVLAVAAVMAAAAGCTDHQDSPTSLRPSRGAQYILTGPSVTVTNTSDAAGGTWPSDVSLRYAMQIVPSGSTILFDPNIAGKTITLTLGALQPAKPM